MTATTFSEWLALQFSTTATYAKDIARAADVSEGYLSGLRTAKRGSPSASVADRIAGAFASARDLSAAETAVLQADARQAADHSGRLTLPRPAEDFAADLRGFARLRERIRARS